MVDNKITGLMIYYYFVCKRKLWLFSNDISMEKENENVSLGKYLDESSYSKERKNILINNEINIDFVKREGIIHEIKKSRKIEEASIWQVKYYLYYLEKEEVRDIIAKIDYPLLKKVVEVKLEEGDRERLDKIIDEIYQTFSDNLPPKFELKNTCKKCAYQDLCRI